METTKLPSQEPDPLRRAYRPQFSLRSLLKLVTVTAGIFGALVWTRAERRDVKDLKGWPEDANPVYWSLARGWPFVYQWTYRDGRGTLFKFETSGSLIVREDTSEWNTNWPALAADVVAMAAMLAAIVFGARCVVNLVRAFRRRAVSTGDTDTRLALLLAFSMVALTILAWLPAVILFRRFGFPYIEVGLELGYWRPCGKRFGFTAFAAPMLLLSSGTLSWAAAQKWLSRGSGRVMMTMCSLAVLLLVLILDSAIPPPVHRLWNSIIPSIDAPIHPPLQEF